MKHIKSALLLSASAVVFVVLALDVAGLIPYRVYVIHTGSMGPTIPSRSAVLVREGRYHRGQAITFHVNGITVTHRLVAFNADGTVDTKGDGNDTRDPWHVPRADIVGGVVLAPHYVGFVLVYIRSPLGAGSLLLACIAVWQTVGLARSLQPSGNGARTLTIKSRSM
ncbi:MAG TPA: signal peptidase I [Gaiellaceae bacterium]|nr:signal peptidase I [Gaiellaceae bacterium]